MAFVACFPKPSDFVNTDTFELQLDGKKDGIIGGTEVKSQDELRNFVVAVLDENEGQLCTGTLIAENVVLTAAHCVGPKIEMMAVFFTLKLTPSSRRFQVDKIEIHPDWLKEPQEGRGRGDIALLHFVGTPSKNFTPARLLSRANRKLLLPETEVIVAGYGIADASTGRGPGTLRATTLTIEDPEFSREEITLDQRQGAGTCHGDSGGPAFILVRGSYALWGVTSRGLEDTANTCDQSAVFTVISAYQNWVNRTVNKWRQ